MNDKKKRVNYWMPEQMIKGLCTQAQGRGVSVTQLVREAVEVALEKMTAKKPKRCPNCGWVGSVK